MLEVNSKVMFVFWNNFYNVSFAIGIKSENPICQVTFSWLFLFYIIVMFHLEHAVLHKTTKRNLLYAY